MTDNQRRGSMPSIWQRAPTLFVHGRSGEAILLPYSQKVKLSVFFSTEISLPTL